VKEYNEKESRGRTLKDGPVIFQLEDLLSDEDRTKKNLTLAELNHVFKMYLQERGTSQNLPSGTR
jgi:hypothetical protein